MSTGWKIGITAVVLLVLAMKTRAVAGEKLTPPAYAEGRFIVSVGDKAEPDKQAEEELIAIINWIVLQEEADMARIEAIGEFTEEELLAGNFRLSEALLSFCEEHKGSEAALAAVLVLSHTCMGADKKPCVPIARALREVYSRFPDTWQGRLAPMRESHLLLDGDPAVPEGKRTTEAIELLEKHRPERAAGLDMENPQIKALRTLWKFEPPLRALYLSNIAANQYNMGSAVPKEPDKIRADCERLDKAAETCSQIVKEHPDTAHAKWAKDILGTIPAVKKFGKKPGGAGKNKE